MWWAWANRQKRWDSIGINLNLVFVDMLFKSLNIERWRQTTKGDEHQMTAEMLLRIEMVINFYHLSKMKIVTWLIETNKECNRYQSVKDEKAIWFIQIKNVLWNKYQTDNNEKDQIR